MEFTRSEACATVLALNPLKLRGAQAMFIPWFPGFNTIDATASMDKLTKVTAIFPGLPKEYNFFLCKIGAMIGLIMETDESIVDRIDKFNGLPSLRVLVHGISKLPKQVLLPKPGGGAKRLQEVEYVGLPNECFECKIVGHLARNCPNKISGKTAQTQVPKRSNIPGNDQEWQPVLRRKNNGQSSNHQEGEKFL